MIFHRTPVLVGKRKVLENKMTNILFEITCICVCVRAFRTVKSNCLHDSILGDFHFHVSFLLIFYFLSMVN